MPDLLVIDDLVVDEATGEVLEWPQGAGIDGPERVAWLIRQYDAAREGERAYETAKHTYSRLLGQTLRAFDGRLKTDAGSASWVTEGETRTAHASAVKTAVDAELLNEDEAYTILVAAAKELDYKAVEAWIDSQQCPEPADDMRIRALEAILITKGTRAGYARVTPNTPKPPRIEHRQPDDQLLEELTTSVDSLRVRE